MLVLLKGRLVAKSIEQQINQILFETVAARAAITDLHSKHIQKKQKQNTHLQPTVPQTGKNALHGGFILRAKLSVIISNPRSFPQSLK